MVSMSKKETEEKENKLDDAMTKAKEAANIRMKERDDIANSLKEVEQKKTDERKKRREDRKKKKEASIAKKKRAAEKRLLEDATRLKEEEDAKKRKLDPNLQPVTTWIGAVKQSIEFEDPRYQFGAFVFFYFSIIYY